MIPKDLLTRYCRRMAELQLVVIKSTIEGGDVNGAQWRAWLSDWVTTGSAVAWHPAIGCSYRAFTEADNQGQADFIVKYAMGMDVDGAIRRVSGTSLRNCCWPRSDLPTRSRRCGCPLNIPPSTLSWSKSRQGSSSLHRRATSQTSSSPWETTMAASSPLRRKSAFAMRSPRWETSAR